MNPLTLPPGAADLFVERFGTSPAVSASAPGRLEVLGNHTDYNAGLTLSCAVNFRCHALLAPVDQPVVKLASRQLGVRPESFPLDPPAAPTGHWANYVLGLVAALQHRGHRVPGFALLVDSRVPMSAGLSSSAALEMAVLIGLTRAMGLAIDPIELARIGQQAESAAVGAQTGLLDQLSCLLGRRDRLLYADFKTLDTQTIALPAGWSFVAVDSGVKHDLTRAYNDRRASCEAAAKAMGVTTLRDADEGRLASCRLRMPDADYGCAKHVIDANQRVRDAVGALRDGDAMRLGGLMFESHASSRYHFRNSCPQLDELVEFARADGRCAGARLSGGGFGGVTIHLVQDQHAEQYRADLLGRLRSLDRGDRWSAVCKTDVGALD
ncbi:MAG: galactokinase [Phycisphaeraceae bacterium]